MIDVNAAEIRRIQVSTLLQIVHIRIRTTDRWQDPYDLDAPVVAILGPVDTGKSSLLECIAYALGGDIQSFRGTVHIHLREVEIKIRIGLEPYVLRRSRKTASRVEVYDATGTRLGQFPVREQDREPNGQTISGWLLERLGIDDDFSSVRLPGGKFLDFATYLLPYCYLNQGDIDRHIILPLRLEQARLIVLKLLFLMTTPGCERIKGDIQEAENEIGRRRRRATIIKEYLAGSEITDPDALLAELTDLERRRVLAADRLEQWKKDARAATRLSENDDRRVSAARRAVSEAEASLDIARRKHESASARIRECEASQQALIELTEGSPGGRDKLGLIHLTCPACEVDISGRIAQPGRCYLCGERLAGEDHAAERDRLEATRAQAVVDEVQLQAAVWQAEGVASRARDALNVTLMEVENRAGNSVTPFVDAVAVASADLAAIRAEAATLSRFQASYQRLSKEFETIAQLEGEQAERRSRADREAETVVAGDVLDHLNGIFQRIVRGIDLPHATGRARLDPETFMPLVDEQGFDQRGGGARSAVSIAYSLTLLTYTLESEIARLPALLMIDSPQKNFGSNRDDKQLAHRVYERFLDYAEELKGLAGQRFHRPFQLIIVDNDIHADIARRIKVHRFTREEGFIRNLRDPHSLGAVAGQLSFDEEG